MASTAAGLPAPPAPGSMRWHALLYAPSGARPAALAIFALEDVLRDAATARLDHGVAHTKLQWWREEIARLAEGAPRHPVTQALAAAAAGNVVDWRPLQQRISALELDLACATIDSGAELDAYLRLSAGTLLRVWAQAAGARLDAAALTQFSDGAGAAIRSVEIIRDLRQDATEGRIRLPLDWLAEAGIGHAQLRAADPGGAARTCLVRLAGQARACWAQAIATLGCPADPALRPLRVLGELHMALLDMIERGGFDVGRRRIELGPVQSLWQAWRAARSH